MKTSYILAKETVRIENALRRHTNDNMVVANMGKLMALCRKLKPSNK